MVTCTASNSSDNTATRTFDVTINEYVLPDADNDGFSDSVDQCPTEYSITNNGCPKTTPVIPPTNGTTTMPECEVGGQTYNDIEICATASTASAGLLEFLTQPEILGNPEIFGGSIITLHKNILDPSYGTVGLVMTDSQGNNNLLTNEHNIDAADNMDENIKIHTWLYPFGIEVGTIGNVVGLTDSAITTGTADAELITITAENIDVFPNQIRYNDEVLTVTSFGGVDNIGDSKIYYAGANGDGSGELLYTGISSKIGYTFGLVTLTDHAVGTYPAISGDSGAPIFIKNGTNATLLGINTGGGCNYTLANGTMVSETSPNGQPCHPHTNPAFRIFSTWENIATELNIP